ncbi:MAG TPA: peptidyl-prolyl cis-trans isomerase [Acidobacteriota bacterium]|nr:peptidyl-prolyl cis-trans isomerase [Acidobacteriota bacterium]
MLDVLRKWNIGIKVILGFVILTFILFYAGTFAKVGGRDASRNMAEVGNEPISNVEFLNTLKLMENQQAQIYGQKEVPEQMKQLFRNETMNVLIDRKLMYIEAKKAGVKVTDQEVISAINRNFSRNGEFVGMPEYKMIVENNLHMDVDSFEKLMAEDLTVQKYNDLLTSGILISDQELEDQYKKNNLTAKIDFVAFDTAGSAADVDVKPEDVRAYYEAHKQDFATGEQCKVQYLWVSHDSEKNRVQVSEDQLKQYYDSHPEQYSRGEQVRVRHILLKTDGKNNEEVKKKAEGLVAQLRAGADFAAFAKQYSEDTGSKDNGGDLGFFERGRMLPEFEQAAFALQPNQISDPVSTMYGYHIIQGVDRKPASKIEFVLVKDQISRQLSLPKAIFNAQEQAKSIYNDVKTNHKTLADISKVQLIDLRTTDYFSQNEDLPGLSPAFRERAFGLKKGDVAEPVQGFQDFAVIQLMDTKPSEIPPFEKAQAKATEKYRQSKAEEVAQQKAQAFYDGVAAAGGLQAAADKAKLTVKSSENFSKSGYIPNVGTAPEVSRAAFAMQVGQVSKPVKSERGYLVFALKEKKDFNQADFDKEKSNLRNQLIQEKQNDFLSSYRSMLRKKYEKQIWINENALNLKA